jgi:predicted ArsR family transcriptional regulator
MHHCPFHDLAETAPEVVCAVHRGVIDGALAELGSGLAVSELQVFPRPDVCVARLAPPRPEEHS